MNPIVGMGELLWDIYPDGRRVAGGAPFNFAFHCQQLGHPAVIVSRVGDDELGCALRDEVRRLNLSDAFIQTDREHTTGTVQVALDAASIPSYTIRENVAWDHIEWNAALNELVGQSAALCVGTLAQRQPESRQAVQAALEALPRECIFDVNLRQQYFTREMITSTLFRCRTVKVNDEELQVLAELLGWRGTHRDELVAELFRFSAIETQRVIVTLGGAGSVIYTEREAPLFTPVVPATLVDTVGAGDAFTAAMVCLLLEARSLAECALFASHYAARVCEHRGATPHIDRHEIESAAFGK